MSGATVTMTLPVEVALSALIQWDMAMAEAEYRIRQALEACATEEQRVAYGHRATEEYLRELRVQLDTYAAAYRCAPVIAAVSP